MNFNRENFIKKLDNIFDSHMKNILSEEEQKFINLKNKMNNDVFIIEKTLIKNGDSEFLSKINLKNTKKIREALSGNGKSVIIIYNERKTPIFVDGNWDNADINLFEIKNKKYIKVQKDNKFGLININGNVVIRPLYSDIKESIDKKYIWASKTNNDYEYFLMSLKENILSPENLFFSGKKLFKNQNNEEFLFGKTKIGEMVFNITKQEYFIKDTTYKKIKINEEKFIFKVQGKNNKFGIIGLNGIILNPIYEHINIFNDTIQITENKKIGLYKMSGEEIVPAEYDKIIKLTESEITLLKNKEKIKINI